VAAAEDRVDTASSVEIGATAELSWQSLPARRSPLRTGLVMIVLAAMFAFVSWYTSSAFMGLVLTVVLALSLGAYFFPTWYTFSADGIVVRTLVTKMQRPWATYRSHWPDRNGVLLSPFPHPSRLENFRGVFIRFENNRDEVLAFVRRYVPEGES
jgi:hypothetical protein